MHEIKPYYTSIGKLYGAGLFEVPKYQRNYAWGREQLEDFLSDITKCLEARLQGEQRQHFFGGIVTVKQDIPGTSDEKYQLVDGQQRVATFAILMSQVAQTLNSLLVEANELNDEESKNKIESTSNYLERKYIETRIMVNMSSEERDRVTLSGPDNNFYQECIRGQSADPGDRASKQRLEQSFSYVRSRIENITNEANNLGDKLNILSKLINVIENDCSLINIVTEDRKYAYELFQVLNDRGIQLTVGDLLRAKALEILEDYPSKQRAAKNSWDDILKDEASDTKDFLGWIHSTFTGGRPRKSSLYDDCLAAFYPQHSKKDFKDADADRVLATTKEIKREIEYCRKLVRGEWPFEPARVGQLQKNRLRLLTVVLGNKSCIPLLIGARHTDESTFDDIVDLTTRLFFRYRTIGGKHATPIINLYAEIGNYIYKNEYEFSIEQYRDRLEDLISDRGPDSDSFAANLKEELRYKPRGNNQTIKFFLMMIEHYYKWYKGNKGGVPKILDSSVVFDFPNTDIEHIYPQLPREVRDELESLKHTLGNLTLLGPNDNKEVSNYPFNDKKKTFSDSKFRINNPLGEMDSWDENDIRDREEELVELALSIFSF